VSSYEIASLVWPQALTMLFQFMIGLTDVAVAGRIHPHLQGTIGIITQLQFFLLVIGLALVNGSVAAISQSLGARLMLRADRYVGLLFKVGALFCAVTMLIGFTFATHVLDLLHVPEELYAETLELWLLFLPVLPASYLTFITVAVFRANKIVGVPLASAVVVCIINAVGDIGLGLGKFGLPNLGAHGLIYASILSVGAGGLFNLAVLLRKNLLSRRSFAPWRWERRAFPYVLKVGLPSGGTQLLWQLGYMMLFMITNTLPKDNVVAVNGLVAGLRIEGLLFMPALAFSVTASVLVGHCLGAGDPAEAKRVGLRVAAAGVLSMGLLAACIYPWLPEITNFVSPRDISVQAVAVSYMVFNLLAVPFTVTSMVMGGIFSGAGATLYSLLAFAVGTWVVRLPLAWYMGHIVWQDASGVFVAMLISQVVQASICLYIFFYRDWYRFASTVKRFERKGAV
jgi:MATE family multidrug resistance protein